jgi:hypothetical protein
MGLCWRQSLDVMRQACCLCTTSFDDVHFECPYFINMQAKTALSAEC